ncbi:MAG TPA: multicopper oxidase domain-containing protein [Polyangia bacterium]
MQAGAFAALALAASCGDAGDAVPRRAGKVYAGKPVAPVVQLALQSGVRVYPGTSERIKEVRLDVMNDVVDLGEDGKYVGWSFGGQIPGPTIRVRAGDRVRLTMTNRTDETLPGLRIEAAPQAPRFAGVMTDRADEGKKIAPGETLELELTAMAPGVHLYQGVLPTAEEAIAAGLYGMLIVDPAEGWGTTADREFAVVQGELYTQIDPHAQPVDAAVRTFGKAAFASKRPTHFGYGGRFVVGEGLRLPAEPGERLRLFVLNPGPNITGRFSLQDLPIDRVFVGAGWSQKPAGPVALAPGAGAVVEVVVAKKGRYKFQDQQLAAQGLLGLIDAARGEKDATPLVVAPPKNAVERRERAHGLYVERCVSCHDPAPGMMRLAPELAGVVKRRSRDWLVKWLMDPPKMQAEDATAQELVRQWNNLPMPQVMLSPDQIDWMLEYLAALPVKKG